MALEFHVGLDVVEKILSDPVWKEEAKKVSCKNELRMLLLRFCSERGAIVRLDEKNILLFADY